jgi:hypothetical protein
MLHTLREGVAKPVMKMPTTAELRKIFSPVGSAHGLKLSRKNL